MVFMIELVKSFLRSDEEAQVKPLEGQYYRRTGSCNMCGKCCTNIFLVHDKITIQTEEAFEALREDNAEYQYFVPISSTEEGLRFQCIHLQEDKSCGIYDDRPDFCKRYPSEHSLLMGGQLAEGCGYSFQLLKTFQQVLTSQASVNTNKGKSGDSDG